MIALDGPVSIFVETRDARCKIEWASAAFVNLREAIAAPCYALTCRRVRIRVTGGATGAFSASLRARKMR